MFKLNKNLGVAAVTLVLGMSLESNALAGSNTQFALVTKHMNRESVSEWGWWVRDDWESYQRKGLSLQANDMLRKAANYGNAQAQYVLGMMYTNFESDERAFYWLNKAAEQGHASAKFAYEYYLNDADDLGIGC